MNRLGLDTHSLNLWIVLDEAATALLFHVFSRVYGLVGSHARSVQRLLNGCVVKPDGGFIVETSAITVVTVLDTFDLGSNDKSSLDIKQVVVGSRPITANACVLNNFVGIILVGVIVV